MLRSQDLKQRNIAFLFSLLIALAMLLLLGACGPDLDESAGNPIAAVELADRMQAGSPPLVLDVRTPDEYASGHIPGAANIPHEQLPMRLRELPVTKTTEIVVHCQSGRRAQLAKAILREGGYSNVRDLAGHWQAWQASGLPTE